MINAIIFDMDGTLVDTELAAAKAVEECFLAWDHKVTAKDAHFVTGRTWETALKYLFAKYPPMVSLETATLKVLESYRKKIETDLVEVPGARESVRALAVDYPLALVSGSHRQEIFSIVARLGITDCFKVILGAEDYPNSKPAPDGFLKAAHLLGVRAEKTLVFEDSVAGIEAGLAAKMQVCVITMTNHFGQDTKKGHHFIPNLTLVNPDWVKALRAPANSG